MHWSTNLLSEIYDRIQDGLATEDTQVLSSIPQLAQDALSDLRGLLTTPGKSEKSLSELKKGKLAEICHLTQIN
jgi:hypothetical protein